MSADDMVMVWEFDDVAVVQHVMGEYYKVPKNGEIHEDFIFPVGSIEAYHCARDMSMGTEYGIRFQRIEQDFLFKANEFRVHFFDSMINRNTPIEIKDQEWVERILEGLKDAQFKRIEILYNDNSITHITREVK